MRPFPRRNYRTPTRHFSRVAPNVGGDEEEDWPGDGTVLLGNVSQGTPQNRFGNQVEETTTGWVIWYPYDDVVEAGVVIRRGDQIHIDQPEGDDIVLRVTANATDYNQLHINWFVQASQVV